MSYTVVSIGYLSKMRFPLMTYKVKYKLVYEQRPKDSKYYLQCATVTNPHVGYRLVCI